MKVTPSPLVARLSGKAASAVAASWKGILYVREHVIPHNPKSAAQVTQRGYFARMSAWFRSLPSGITDWLDDLAVGLGKSGFNLMSGLDLKHLALSENPEIVPGNPKCDALFSAADATSVLDNEVDLAFVAGNAISTYFVHAFTCPVDPDEAALTEPDGWSYAATPVEVSTGAYAKIAVANIAKAYYVALIVADTNDLATATKISGGIGLTCTSGETP